MSLREIWREHERIQAHVTQAMLGGPLPPCNRGSWFCPCVSLRDARTIAALLKHYAITTVFDLGAGDLRLARFLAEEGFTVTAYETYSELIGAITDACDCTKIRIRCRDYWTDWKRITNNGAAILVLGGSQRIPALPSNLTILGYDRIGTVAVKDGVIRGRWGRFDECPLGRSLHGWIREQTEISRPT